MLHAWLHEDQHDNVRAGTRYLEDAAQLSDVFFYLRK
jgi:hypothetical protein